MTAIARTGVLLETTPVGPLSAQLRRARPRSGMSAKRVRREKAARSSGCKPHPANAPAGSNWSSHGGDEMAEALGVAGHSERSYDGLRKAGMPEEEAKTH
jgi:hypothetical protein